MSVPVWAAATAYLVSARVTPATPDGTVWKATVAGTSGNSEPAWPAIAPWTVTDGGVTWIRASSWRQGTVAGIVAVLTTFRSANPTMLHGISAARPKSMTNFDLPGAYVGPRDESIDHTSGVRTRTFDGLSVVVVDVLPDNAEAQARMDALVDGLTDHFTDNYHGVDGYSILEQTATAEVPFEEGGIPYLANELTFAGTSKAEGRT